MNEDRGRVTAPPEAVEALRLLDGETARRIVELVSAGPDPVDAWPRVVELIRADPAIFGSPGSTARACALAGASRALSRDLARSPALMSGVSPSTSLAQQARAALIAIAGDDLAGSIGMAEATSRFSDEIDGVVARALAAARLAVAEKRPSAADLPFAVIAMGKWGARELNYSSDVDLVFVHDSSGDDNEDRMAALDLASRLMSDLGSASFDGPGLRVDADLRPEGTMGPLSRSLESYRHYYERWGEPWELQALLKARFAAGTVEVGIEFMDLATTLIWQRGLDPLALRSIRRIKAETESSASVRDIKRSRGGIRDIEFSVQLLQLVHGRLDTDLRTRGTLDALHALATHEYIEPADHEELVESYRFLRDLEHRIQLWDVRQTHLLPTDPDDLTRIGRSMGFDQEPAVALQERLAVVRASVRDIHERLYFRPILDSLVGSPSAKLGVEEASLRLEALGFEDVRSARRALADLTAGINRRARVMHQMLPLMLDWLSVSPNPDLGLAQLRTVLAHTPDHAALVTLLQTNPLAGERLCMLLGTGRLLGDLIDRIPEFIPRLADEALLGQIREAEAATDRLIGLLDGRPDPDAKIGTIRRFTRRRKLRIAARDVVGNAPTTTTLASLADSADAAIRGALHIATEGDPSGFGVIAMGKWGGKELSYGSDLDLMYVFANDHPRDDALRTATELSRILSDPSRHGEGYQLDAELRPEGRGGPMARSLDSYRRYYEEWAEPWEMLALIRARPVAGDPAVGSQFMKMIEPVIWREEMPREVVHAIRAIKARVENERIPHGEDPDYHLKLGKGSLSDIEFLTQLLQLTNGGNDPSLRVSSTILALDRLGQAGLLNRGEQAALEDAYLFCTRVRLRLHLQSGRVSESLPTDRGDLSKAAASLGYDRAMDLREQYRRVTRRARHVFEARFY